MRKTHEFTVPESMNGARADNFLRNMGVSRRLIVRSKHTEGGITRNGELLRGCDTVFAGDTVVISEGEYQVSGVEISIAKAFENEDIIIYDKPAGMAVHPSQNHRSGTLKDVFESEFTGLVFRPVNRLDKNTSGLCLCAKNAYAAECCRLSREKEYLAAVCGEINEKGIIDAPIGRADDSVIMRTVRADGKPSVTEYEPIVSNGKYTLLRIKLHTGRTHQIRVHMSYMGYPLAGDSLYGGNCTDISRQALHCSYTAVTMPYGRLEADSLLPDDISRLFR